MITDKCYMTQIFSNLLLMSSISIDDLLPKSLKLDIIGLVIFVKINAASIMPSGMQVQTQ